MLRIVAKNPDLRTDLIQVEPIFLNCSIIHLYWVGPSFCLSNEIDWQRQSPPPAGTTKP